MNPHPTNFTSFFSSVIACLLACFFAWSCSSDNPEIILKKAAPQAKADFTVRKEVRTIAFGSCANPELDMPMLSVAIRRKPDLFIWLGDNVYADTKDVSVLEEKHRALGAHPDFLNLKSSTRMLATWDDHDYGWNDAGRHYSLKKESKEVFLSFWEEPFDSPRRQHPGIYASYLFDGGRQDVHVILLDMRSFRDDLLPAQEIHLQGTNNIAYAADYEAYRNGDSTLLGFAQWAWLEKQLDVKADVRVIATSTQFGIEWNGYESWANFPHEQEKIAQMIQQSKANQRRMGQKITPIIFISGDVHYGEISAWTSRSATQATDTLFDITSSGITSKWDFATPNAHRLDGPLMDNNIGILEIGRPGQAQVVAQLWDVKGKMRISRDIVK